MHKYVILTNKRRTRAQSNHSNTKLKVRFRCLLCHPARKQSGAYCTPRTHKGWWWPPSAVLHSWDEPDEVLQWLWYDDSIVIQYLLLLLSSLTFPSLTTALFHYSRHQAFLHHEYCHHNNKNVTVIA